jgi:hypothetical protein
MLGAGHAREMACAPANLAMKLLPWAGIAAHIGTSGPRGEALARCAESGDFVVAAAAAAAAASAPSTIVEATALRGRGYCFLPLPVETRLPVHVNGYFELSSNRRDVWFGDDMAGVGAKRSQWNQVRFFISFFLFVYSLCILICSLLTLCGISSFSRTSSHQPTRASSQRRRATAEAPRRTSRSGPPPRPRPRSRGIL